MPKDGVLHFQYVLEFFHQIIPYLEDKPVLRQIENGPVLYVGDIHGFFEDLQNAFDVAEKKQVHTLVFLGDYADRGPEQLHCLVKVLDAFARSSGYNQKTFPYNFIHEKNYPFQVIALRGNHENIDINIAYGFSKELIHTHNFPEFPKKALEQVYSNLPIATITKWKTLGLHGGIPMPKTGECSSKFIQHLITKRTPLTELSPDLMTQITQVLWNDPYFGDITTDPTFRRSYRGPNIYEFNQAALEVFLTDNGYLRLVRAHETAQYGFEVHWGNKLVHIFSASPYFGRVRNAAYFLEFEDCSGEIVDGSGKCLKKIDPPI